MKKLITILQAIGGVLLFIDLSFWAALYGSGHKIPIKTDITLGCYASTLIFLLIVLWYLNRKRNKY